MKKRVVIAHGWDEHPQAGWLPWLKNELEKRGHEVTIPQLPDPSNPRIQNWVPAFAEAVGLPDKDTFLIGHSMGCQTIARYLATLPDGVKVGGVIFVAGFFKHLTGLEDDPQVMETDKHWLSTPIDLLKVKERMQKSVAIFSDNDPWVPLDNQDDFRDKLGSKIIIEHNQGHFWDKGMMEFPLVLEELVKL